jgi:hypothetical protein
VEDITNGVLFLASDLSRSVTGVILHIDGGAIAALGFLDWPDDSFMPAPLGATPGRLAEGVFSPPKYLKIADLSRVEIFPASDCKT